MPEAVIAGSSGTDQSGVPRYMPGLDVLRGIAISMVLLYHGLAPQEAILRTPGRIMGSVHSALEMGSTGVHLFFVLSGFLITGILLNTKGDPERLRNFYSRRALRILPAYFAMLLLLKITSSITWRFLAVALLFLCNMPRVLGAQPEYGPLWSLSVEEQFYLFWPLFTQKLSVRGLALLSGLIVLLTPLLRFFLTFAPPALADVHFKVWVVGDFLATGALIAVLIRTVSGRAVLPRLPLWLFTGGMFGYLGIFLIERSGSPYTERFLAAISLDPWLLTCAASLIFAFQNPRIARWMIFRPFVFLANISYGLYLCHQFLFHAVEKLWPAQTVEISILRFIAGLIVSIGVAYVSRNTLEAFFLKQKPKAPSTHRNGVSVDLSQTCD